MKLRLTPELSREIRGQYDKYMGDYPAKRAEVEAFCRSLSETEGDCLRFLYGHMPVSDIVSFSVETIFHYVAASLAMYEKLDYARKVPQELFLSYVLSVRVNNEYLDDSRKILFDMLLPRVRGKGMAQAALEVNYWCYEKATYIPSDARTLGPLGMMKAAKGRCGEESTLTVSALRAVGIPARQCYSPRWAHCDDNHAWVELWVDGAWHYMGACEPEPVLDKGWFTAAASKAMLVHSKAYSHFLPGEDVAAETPIYSLIHSTPVYGACRQVTVQVLEGGKPKQGVDVHFQLVNYSELYTIYQATTDEEGKVRFTGGMGDVYIFAADHGKMAGGKLDLRKGDKLVLDLDAGIGEEETMDFEMVSPKETVGGQGQEADWAAHSQRFRACGEIRETYEKTFSREGFLGKAKGNQGEIRSFLEDPRFAEADKIQLLSTLRDKDFLDISASTLVHYLKNTLPYKGEFPEDIYTSCLLAPRIADEMILPLRGKIGAFLSLQKLEDGQAVWEYLCAHIRLMPSYGTDNFTADAYGMLRYGMGPASSFPVLFVAVCRSLGIPARLNPVTLEPEYVVIKGENAEFIGVSHKENQETASLTLRNESGRPLNYSFQFSLGLWKDGAYQTLHYFGFELKERVTWALPRGHYRLLTAARQIDGSVSARATYFQLNGDREIPVTLCEDRTKEKLKSAEIPDVLLYENVSIKKSMGDGKSLVIFPDPGMEPTEHLLQELLECREEYNRLGYKILLILDKPSGNPTLLRVLKELHNAAVYHLEDPDYLRQLHVLMGVGDERLPFAMAVDAQKKGLFAFANYNIRTAQTILNILK